MQVRPTHCIDGHHWKGCRWQVWEDSHGTSVPTVELLFLVRISQRSFIKLKWQTDGRLDGRTVGQMDEQNDCRRTTDKDEQIERRISRETKEIADECTDEHKTGSYNGQQNWSMVERLMDGRLSDDRVADGQKQNSRSDTQMRDRWTDRQTYGWTNEQTDWWTDRQTYEWKNEQTDWWTEVCRKALYHQTQTNLKAYNSSQPKTIDHEGDRFGAVVSRMACAGRAWPPLNCPSLIIIGWIAPQLR